MFLMIIPNTDNGLLGMKKLIMLMMCCSVQCENNEKYVNKIKEMDKNAQVEIMTLIKKVGIIRNLAKFP